MEIPRELRDFVGILKEDAKKIPGVYFRRIEPPSMENAKRFMQDLAIASIALGTYTVGRDIALPESQTTEIAMNFLMVGSGADSGAAFIAAGIRAIRSFSLFHQDHLSGAFRRSQLPPTLS